MMTGEEVYDLVDQARDWIGLGFQKKIGTIVLDPEMRAGTGQFSPSINEASIGVRDFVEHPERKFTEFQVTSIIDALFHETYGHGLHYNFLFPEKTDMTTAVLAFNAYACSYSSEYYGYGMRKKKPFFGNKASEDKEGVSADDLELFMKDRYWHQPTEIAAEYAGVRMGYEFLSDVYGKKKASRMISNYMNLNSFGSFGSYYACSKMPCRNAEDVFQVFHKEFSKSVFRNRPYNPSADFDDRTGEWGPFVRWSRLIGRPELAARSQKHMTGIQQDMIQAQAAIYVSPYLRSKPLPKVFQGSYDFGAAFILDKLPEELKRINKEARPVRAKPSLSHLDEAMAEVRSLESKWAGEPDNPLYQPDYY